MQYFSIYEYDYLYIARYTNFWEFVWLYEGILMNMSPVFSPYFYNGMPLINTYGMDAPNF